MDKMLRAKEVNEDIINKIDKQTKYVIVMDAAMLGKHDLLMKAINLFVQKGWKCINITGAGHELVFLYALLKR